MATTKPYIRRPGARVLNTTLDREAFELLQTFAPSERTYGSTLNRLIYEERARREERERAKLAVVGTP